MRHGGKAFVCLLSCFVLTMGAKAITSSPGSIKNDEKVVSNTGDDPYSAIARRNVFDLKEPDTNSMVPPVHPPPSNVSLTGIMTVLSQKLALFMIQKPSLPGKPAETPVSCILTEGQRQEGVEVLEIDEKSAKVKIGNDGTVSTITFEAHKAEPAGVPTSPAVARLNRPGFNPNFIGTR